MNILLTHLKIHFDYSLDMLIEEIDACPAELWSKKAGGFVFWQQIVHALTGVLFWTRTGQGEFSEPFKELEVFPELDGEPKGSITKEEMKAFSIGVRKQADVFFTGNTDDWLKEKNVIYDKVLNIDIIEMQIKHLQYHTGHCNSILRENNIKAVEWKEYFG